MSPRRATGDDVPAYVMPVEGVALAVRVGPGVGLEVAVDLSGLRPDGGQLALELDA